MLLSLRVGFFLALRQLRRSGKGTTTLIIFVMILTFLNLVVVSGLLVGLISGSFKQFREAYSGEVLVTSADGRDYIENSPALISFLESHPKVEAISPRYSVGVQLLGTLTDLPGKNERANRIGISLTGIDPAREEVVTGFSRFLKYGEHLNEGEEGYILIGANMIKKYSSFADANIPGLTLLEDVDIGSRVRVSFSRAGGGVVSKEFIIKGIVKSKVDEISTRAFITDKELKKLLPVNKEQVQSIAIRTDYEYAPTLVAETKDFMEGHAARIQTTDEAIPSFLRDIEQTFSILGNALSSVALIVASITVFIVIFINAVTKRKFIGIMKGIGISPQAIQFSYIFQALFYGVIGSLIGVILTFGILKPYFDVHPIDFPFSDGILVATAEGAAIRIAILLTVTLIAGYIPAKLIVRKNTLDSILGR
ncbi:MAG: FtsX-like permease family protein [Patescibacteria group bacterium]